MKFASLCAAVASVGFHAAGKRIYSGAGMLVLISGVACPWSVVSAQKARTLAATPPMGWNDWAHYECSFNAQTILSNAKALIRSGLAAHGYDTVTIDDCWMQKDRDTQGDLQVDPERFPQGMKPVADAVHALGLKFGIYEDAGSLTCGGFAGSGEPHGGGKDHFLQDAKLFSSWGVDYLKLDGCNVYVAKGGNEKDAYRKAYAAESAALRAVDRPIVFSESAPAYFQGTPDWYDVLYWVGNYGQLWREGSDIATFNPKKPDTPRFQSVLWNYSYNLPLGRFQKPGNWNDADFIIGGDHGMSMVETRSQVSLWSMMSAPLILSSDLDTLDSEAVAILDNKAILAIDQDARGIGATLVRRSPAMDVLFKPLSHGNYAVAVLNHGSAPLHIALRPADLGFASGVRCRLEARNLWSATSESAVATLQADILTHDTAVWQFHPEVSCGAPARTGAITMIATGRHRDIEAYSRCLAASGHVGDCVGAPEETWTVTSKGALESAGRCLGNGNGKPFMQTCAASQAQYWKYTLAGNLVSSADGRCLSGSDAGSKSQGLSLQPCGHNLPNQIWSLPQ